MKTKYYDLDGVNSGFVALNPEGEVVHFKSGKCFKNKSILDAVIETNGMTNYCTYGMMLNGKLVPISKILFLPEINLYHEYFEDSNTLSIIGPERKDKLLIVGYFSFGEDPTERIMDVKEGIKYNNKCYDILQDSISHLVRIGELRPRVRDYNDYNTNRIPGSTIRFRIMRPCDLVKVNEYRKNIGFKCLPFNKNLDRFKSMYYIFSIDENDPYIDISKRNYPMINITLENLEKYIKEKYPNDKVTVTKTEIIRTIEF